MKISEALEILKELKNTREECFKNTGNFSYKKEAEAFGVVLDFFDKCVSLFASLLN